MTRISSACVCVNGRKRCYTVHDKSAQGKPVLYFPVCVHLCIHNRSLVVCGPYVFQFKSIEINKHTVLCIFAMIIGDLSLLNIKAQDNEQ